MSADVQVAHQQLLIGGEWRDAASGATVEKRNPFNGRPAGSAAAAGREDATATVEAAAQAFAQWSERPLAERREILDGAAQLLLSRQAEIAGIMTEETGATFGWGMFNVELAAGMLQEAGVQAERAHDEEITSHVPGKTARAVRQPVGVVVGIAPWNAPVILGTRALAAPLAYGNTVILKASEESPRSHGVIVEALVQAGAPDGVINLVTNAPQDAADVVDELIADPLVRRINFTGSTRVGRLIAEKAGRHLKRVLLELGGKAPMIVLADADLQRAAAAASFGAFMHQGQICMSTERIVVDATVAEEFADMLAERARSLSVGDPSDPATQIGPLLNQVAVERVAELVQDAVSHGARLLAGGSAQGAAYAPTVLAGVTAQMRIYRAESFGPVASIVQVDGLEEAVRVANDTEYGLSAAVFSNDVDQALEVARRLETGMCHVNDTTVQDEPQMPFGGVKESGWGRFGGQAALEEFTELRWITVQEQAREYPI